MDSSALHPPNVHTLSDCVIGKVVASSLWPKYGLNRGGDDNALSSSVTSTSSSRPQYLQQPVNSVVHAEHQAAQSARSTRAADPFKHKGMLNPARQKVAVIVEGPDQNAAKILIEIEKAKTELRRKRRRTNMQRYRKKMEGRAITLEGDVGKLREETQTLQLQHQTLSSGVPTGKTALSVVAEYFRLFRYGLKGSTLTNDPHGSTKGNAHVSSVQRDFLHAATSPDVVGETGFGVESLIEDYRRLALYLPESDTQLVRLDTGPGDSLTATTTVGIIITAKMLHFAFPHLIHNEEQNQWSPIAAKLLGQRFVLRGTIHFKWDSVTSRLTLVQSRADLLTPLLNVLGDLETVSRLFDEALITPECKLSL